MIAGAGSRSSRGRRSFTRGVEVVVAFFFLMNGGRRLLQLVQLRRAVRPLSLREEVKATFRPLRTRVGAVRVAGGGVGGTRRPQDPGLRALGGRTHLDPGISARRKHSEGGERRTPARGLLFL